MKKVLIADDEPNIIILMEQTLEILEEKSRNVRNLCYLVDG